MAPLYEHRVQYYETDQMGVAHHSNYIRWFEEARSAYMEYFGLTYRQMEEEGVIIPVVSVSAEYKSMSRYWDLLSIETRLTEYNGVRAGLSYVIRDAISGELKCTGTSSHCFLNREGQLLSLKRSFPKMHQVWEKMLEEAG